jgi:hypothetical protein
MGCIHVTPTPSPTPSPPTHTSCIKTTGQSPVNVFHRHFSTRQDSLLNGQGFYKGNNFTYTSCSVAKSQLYPIYRSCCTSVVRCRRYSGNLGDRNTSLRLLGHFVPGLLTALRLEQKVGLNSVTLCKIHNGEKESNKISTA